MDLDNIGLHWSKPNGKNKLREHAFDIKKIYKKSLPPKKSTKVKNILVVKLPKWVKHLEIYHISYNLCIKKRFDTDSPYFEGLVRVRTVLDKN